MFVILAFIAASAAVGGYATYASRQAIIPQLQYRPGTPDNVVESCRQAAIAAARTHAAELGAELVRVDAASAGEMRRARGVQTAPVEVGIVYARPSGQETRQGVIECRVSRQGAVLAGLPGAAR
jgi:hypothetical protein